jgi:hypothetical protein
MEFKWRKEGFRQKNLCMERWKKEERRIKIEESLHHDGQVAGDERVKRLRMSKRNSYGSWKKVRRMWCRRRWRKGKKVSSIVGKKWRRQERFWWTMMKIFHNTPPWTFLCSTVLLKCQCQCQWETDKFTTYSLFWLKHGFPFSLLQGFLQKEKCNLRKLFMMVIHSIVSWAEEHLKFPSVDTWNPPPQMKWSISFCLIGRKPMVDSRNPMDGRVVWQWQQKRCLCNLGHQHLP